MYTKVIYKIADGTYSFDILSDGSTVVHQDMMPDVYGKIGMTEEQANHWADVIIGRMV